MRRWQVRDDPPATSSADAEAIGNRASRKSSLFWKTPVSGYLLLERRLTRRQSLPQQTQADPHPSIGAQETSLVAATCFLKVM